VQSSQAMADSVVRYLVTEHQVPLYRIYRTGLGKNANAVTGKNASASAPTETASTQGEAPPTFVNGVRVTLLHNSLASMTSSSPSTSSNSYPAPPAAATTGAVQ